MNKSQARAESDALECYWKVLGMARQLEANELTVAAEAFSRASVILEKAVESARKREQEDRNLKIEYHKRQMRPEVLAQTEALDRSKQLEAENVELRAKMAKKV